MALLSSVAWVRYKSTERVRSSPGNKDLVSRAYGSADLAADRLRDIEPLPLVWHQY